MANNDITGIGFEADLSRYRRFWQTGLLLRDLLSLCGLGVVLILVCGLLDFFMAFETAVRLVLESVVGVILLFLWAVRLVRVFSLSDRDMAIRADTLLSGQRRSILSAYELTLELAARAGSMSDMHVFLLQSSIQKAAAELKKLRMSDYFPVRALGRQCLVLICQIAAAGLIMLLNRDAGVIIAKRLVYPMRDIPPYSRYVFDVNPQMPMVIYGGDVEVNVNITGAPVDSSVWLVTRYGGTKYRAACFLESGGKYAQRLEKVVNDVEFCFAVGHARSRWHKVDLRLQPKIALASAVITPPSYTRLPAKQMYIGNADLAAYRLSNISVTLTSNRPLLDGALTIKPRNGLGADEIVNSGRVNDKSLSFEWTVTGEADLEFVIRDLRGTPGREPLHVVQKVIVDKQPQAVITEPAEFVLATPEISIPFRGYAEDDLALSRVELVKTVVGYRDRIQEIGPDAPVKKLDFDSMLDLKRLGVRPGQALEFFMEAGDLNPDMMGISASSVVRVQIISEEEYADMLRAKERIEDFTKRYYMLDDKLDNLREALKALKQVAEAEGSSDADLKKALDDAMSAADDAEETGRRIADDFPIYEMETSLASLARSVAGMAAEIKAKLGQSVNSRTAMSVNATAMLRALGEKEKEMDEKKADAEELAMLYRVMECSGRFMELYRQQSELVNRLQRFEMDTSGKDLRLLASLGTKQSEIKIELQKLAADIIERAGRLTNMYNALKNTAIEFAGKIGELGIPPAMEQAAGYAANQDGGQTLHYSTLALEKMEQLLSDCENGGFGGMCKGQIKFQVSKEMQATLNQMMQSMGRGNKGGQGTGGGGIGGDLNDGYSMGGYSPVNTPAFGPERMNASGKDGRSGSGEGQGKGTSADVKVHETEKMELEKKGVAEGEAMPMENVPDKYRDAVKKYFAE